MLESLCIIQIYVMISIVTLYFSMLTIWYELVFFIKYQSQIKNKVREYSLLRAASSIYQYLLILIDPQEKYYIICFLSLVVVIIVL